MIKVLCIGIIGAIGINFQDSFSLYLSLLSLAPYIKPPKHNSLLKIFAVCFFISLRNLAGPMISKILDVEYFCNVQKIMTAEVI